MLRAPFVDEELEGYMRNGNLEQQTVDQVITHASGTSDILRSYGIDPSSRMPLALAAAAVSVPADELLAVLEYRMRRMAQVRMPAVVDEEVGQELAVGA
jgi:hypothetical protein